ncbi:Uncharacterised protein [Neisseria meningitidis]|nr:Uncharacterised protein [Neisseria meningitidis]CWU04051.1 Uncharacterised protein [Neisseria meningitidis]
MPNPDNSCLPSAVLPLIFRKSNAPFLTVYLLRNMEFLVFQTFDSCFKAARFIPVYQLQTTQFLFCQRFLQNCLRFQLLLHAISCAET